jgi:hypothetical protein
MRDRKLMTDTDRKQVCLKVLSLIAPADENKALELQFALKGVMPDGTDLIPQTFWRWRKQPFYQEALLEWRATLAAATQDVIMQSARRMVQGMVDIALGDATEEVVTPKGFKVIHQVDARTRIAAFQAIKGYMEDLIETEQQQAVTTGAARTIINQFFGTVQVGDSATDKPDIAPDEGQIIDVTPTYVVDTPKKLQTLLSDFIDGIDEAPKIPG